jgi:hypothetical protein
VIRQFDARFTAYLVADKVIVTINCLTTSGTCGESQAGGSTVNTDGGS